MNGGKKIPTLVKQIFVMSNFTTKLFVPRKAAFCWYLWMEDSLPAICNLSSANTRLLTLVMTTLGKGFLGELLLFSLGATQTPVPLKQSLVEIHLC